MALDKDRYGDPNECDSGNDADAEFGGINLAEDLERIEAAAKRIPPDVDVLARITREEYELSDGQGSGIPEGPGAA